MEPMEEVYGRYASTVYKYLLSLTRDPGLAEELTQETFFRAIRASGSFDGRSKVPTWLCSIAKNALSEYRRKHRRTVPIDEAEGLYAPSAEDETVGNEERLGLLKKLHSLPEPFREVIYLRSFFDLSFREIGGIMGKTENWARVTYFRGKDRLERMLKDE